MHSKYMHQVSRIFAGGWRAHDPATCCRDSLRSTSQAALKRLVFGCGGRRDSHLPHRAVAEAKGARSNIAEAENAAASGSQSGASHAELSFLSRAPSMKTR